MLVSAIHEWESNVSIDMSPRSWTSFPPLSQPQSIINMIDFINIKTLFLMCCAVLNCSVVSNSLHPMDCSHPGSCVHGDSPGKNTGAGCHALLQGIFPAQGSRPGVPHCRRIPPGQPKNTGVGIPSLLRESDNQESIWGLLNPRQILYQLSYQGSPLLLLFSFVS